MRGAACGACHRRARADSRLRCAGTAICHRGLRKCTVALQPALSCGAHVCSQCATAPLKLTSAAGVVCGAGCGSFRDWLSGLGGSYGWGRTGAAWAVISLGCAGPLGLCSVDPAPRGAAKVLSDTAVASRWRWPGLQLLVAQSWPLHRMRVAYADMPVCNQGCHPQQTASVDL